MRKSFTRLFGLVMFLALLCSVTMSFALGVGIPVTKVLPKDNGAVKAYTKPTDKINVIFGEAVKAGSGYIRLYDTNGLQRTITATDSRISYAKGDTVVIDFSADQKELMEYTVSIDGSAFAPVAIASGTSVSVPDWKYTVGDYTNPTLKSVVPKKDDKVAQTISLAMTFDDAPNLASSMLLGSGKVAVYKADGNVWDLIDVASPGAHTVTFAAGVLTISGIRGLEDLTDYSVTIGAGVITDNGLRADNVKNPYAGLTDRSVWKFSSKDFTIPGLADGYPKIANVGNTSADVLVKASEKGTAYAMFLLRAVPDVANPAQTAAAVKAANNKVAIDAANTEYKISLSGMGAANLSQVFDVYVITENADVTATDADVKTLTCTTSENVKPSLLTVGYVKGDVTTSKLIDNTYPTIDQAITKIVFHFDEGVKVGAGTVMIYKKSDNSVYTSIDASAISINDAGDAVGTLSKAFENNAQYYAFIPSTLFADKWNNLYGGVNTTTSWTFSTNDIIPPTIVSYTPAQGSVNVAKDKSIAIKFSEVITVDPLMFTLQENGTSVPFTYTVDNNNNAYTVVTVTPSTLATADTPANSWPSNSVVTVTVNGNLKDLANNTLGLTQGSSFVAADYIGPKVKSWSGTPMSPSDAIVVKFDEPIRLLGGTPITASNLWTIITLKVTDANGVNVNATYAINSDNNTITITPTSPLASSGTYYAAISSDVEDYSGNKCIDLAAARSQTYTIKDVIPATVSIDVDGKTDVATNATPVISFKQGSTLDEVAQLYFNNSWTTYAPVTVDAFAGMGNVIVLKKGDANGPNIPFTVASADDKAFTVTPATAFDGAQTYYIGIGASTKDASGNLSAAKYASFTTKYVAAPTLSSVSPAKDQTEVGLKATLVATFNTDIQLDAVAYATTPITLAGSPVLFSDLVVSGSTLTIKHGDFAGSTNGESKEIIVPANIVQNKASGANFGGIAAGAWKFTTVDQLFMSFTLAPDFLVTPALNDPLVIVVSEKAVAGTGNITIKNAVTDFLIEQISSTSGQVSYAYDGGANTTTITIKPSANFVYGGQYYVEVDNGAIVDTHGNKIPAIVGKISDATVANWTFTAVNSDLVVTKVSPFMVENVANDADMVVTFNRDIVKGTTGNIGFVEYGFDEITLKQTVNYGISSANLIVSGNTLTIKHPDKPFSNNSTIFVTMESGAIKAASKTSSSTSLAVADGKKFYVGDNLPPVPTVNVTWDDGAKNYVQVNTNITITFNEDVLNVATGLALTNDNVTFSGGIIQLLDATMTPVDFQGTVSGRVITIDPTSNLLESKTYAVVIVNNKIKDKFSHNITPAYTAIFKTIDATNPDAAATLAGAATSVNVSAVTVTDANPKNFYYLLKKESDAAPTVAQVMAGTKKDASSGSVANFSISNLDAATSYVLYFVAEDSFGNVSAVKKTNAASTTDTLAPVLVSTDPANGDVNVDNAKVIALTFSENVVKNPTPPAASKIYMKDKATNAIIMTLDATALANDATLPSKKILLTTGFAGGLNPVLVYIEMDGGLIQDVATTPNAFGGVSGADKIFYTYEDNTAPTVSDFKYSGDDINHVNVNSNLNLVFSEAVQAGTANAILYKSDGDGGWLPVEVYKGTEVSISGNTVSINPTADLLINTAYKLDVQAAFVKDLSSNKNSNPIYSVSFTTNTNVAPVLTILPASSNTIAKTSLTHIVFNFNKNVYLTIAGLKKSLLILTSADVKNQMTFKRGDGTSVPFELEPGMKGSNFYHILVAAADLADLTSYSITVSGYTDIDGLAMDPTTVSYKTNDGKAPVITFNPADKAVNVLGTSALTMTFDKTVYNYVDLTVDGKFYKPFTNDNVDLVVYLKDVTAGAPVKMDATYNGTNVFTITPAAALISSHKYEYGLIDGQVVTDINGNYLNGTDAGTSVQFTVKDTEKPVFTIAAGSVSPDPMAVSVAADAKMWIIFNEEILVGTGSINIRKMDGTIVESISGSGLTKDGDNKMKLNITHKNFMPVSDYFVEIGAGVVTDMTGNTNVAMVDPTKWVFTTKDTYTLTSLNTPMGDNTPSQTNVEMAFNKPATANANKFLAIYKADGTAVYQVAASSMLPASGTKAVFANVPLAKNQAYYVHIEDKAFVDGSGNTLAGINDNSWVFSTVNNISPKVTAMSPLNNATDVFQAATFTLTFDRAIAKGTGSISLRNKVTGVEFTSVDIAAATITGSVLSFNFPVVLEKNVAYYVIIPAGLVTNTEVTKDPYAGISNTYDWTFATGNDILKPTLVSGAPNMVLDAKPKATTLVATFSEAVKLAAGNLVIYSAAKDTVVEKIALTAAMINGKVVTVVPTKLVERASYYVLIDAGSVTDLVGNVFDGLADKTVWTFSTGDYTAPTVVVTNPKAPIPAVFTVGLTFSEPVTGVSDGTGIMVTGGTFTVSGAGKDYVLTVTSKEVTAVTIVLSDLIKDTSAQTNKLVPVTLNYTTGDLTAPTVIVTDPVAPIPASFMVGLKFSKDVTGVSDKSGITVTGATSYTVTTTTAKDYTLNIVAPEKAAVTIVLSDMIKDLAVPANSLVPVTLNYKVGDFTAPTVVVTDPKVPVATTFTVGLAFSEDVVGVSDKSGITVTGATSYTVAGSGKDYTLTVIAPEVTAVSIVLGDKIKDLAVPANSLVPVTLNYKTGDFTAPTVVATGPVAPIPATFNVGLVFSKDVTGVSDKTGITVTGATSYLVTGSGKNYTMIVTAPSQAAVKIVLGSLIKDLAGNSLVPVTLNYNVSDIVPPSVVSFTPTGTITDNHPTFVVTMSEPIQYGSAGNLKVYKFGVSKPTLTIPVTAAMVSGSKITVTYPVNNATIGGLDKNTEYYVLVDAGVVKDMSGNPSPALADPGVWGFKTGPDFKTVIEPSASLEFKVYPNPFVDYVNIENATMLSKIVVTNIAGQTVKQVVNPTDRIQLNELRSGVYFISLYDMDNVIAKTAKIVKR